MSTFDQVKKESIRLFKLAKKTPNIAGTPSLNVSNLSASQNIIAQINGYPDWFQYQKYLQQKEFKENKFSQKTTLIQKKDILKNINLFSVKSTFTFHANKKPAIFPLNNQNTNSFDKITIGHYSDPQKIFNRQILSIKNSFTKKNKEVYCDNFPLQVIGGTGSGISYFLSVLSEQFINTDKPLFFIDGKGDVSTYSKIYSLADKHNKTENLYVFNFCGKKEKQTHSTNLITPLVDNKDVFNSITESIFSEVLQSLCVSIRNKNGIISLDNLHYFLSIENLVSLLSNSIFEESIEVLQHYLNDIDYFSNKNRAVKNHALNCIGYLDFLNTIKDFPEMFSDNPEVTINEIYNKKKFLVILLPALEKSSKDISLLANLLSKQILDQQYKYIDSGVFLDEFQYFLTKKELDNYFYSEQKNDLKDKRKIIFSSHHFSSELMTAVTHYCNSFLLMKIYPDVDSSYFKDLKLKMMDNLEYFPSIFKDKRINKQKPGEAFFYSKLSFYYDEKSVYGKKENGDHVLLPVKCVFDQIKLSEYISLNKTPL